MAETIGKLKDAAPFVLTHIKESLAAGAAGGRVTEYEVATPAGELTVTLLALPEERKATPDPYDPLPLTNMFCPTATPPETIRAPAVALVAAMVLVMVVSPSAPIRTRSVVKSDPLAADELVPKVIAVRLLAALFRRMNEILAEISPVPNPSQP